MSDGYGGHISVHSLTVAYGIQTILHGIDLDFPAGTFTALLGSSGCGKTTLLRTLAGFLKASGGHIEVDHKDVTTSPPEARGMAMVFQSYALWPHMTVGQNMGYGLKLRKMSSEAINRKIDTLLTMLGLEGLANRKVTDLSGGQRQRVALGRALAIEPSILLLDEPLSNLDTKIRLTMRHQIRAIQKNLGLTVIHVTHDREEAMTMADRIIVLDHGRIAQIGTPEDVYDKPNSPFLARFMGAENRLTFSVQEGVLKHENYSLPHALSIDEDRAVVYFRDEAARLINTATVSGDSLTGRVIARSYPGGFYRYSIAVGDAVIAVTDHAVIEPGTEIRLTLDPGKLHIFPASMAAHEEGRA